MTSALIVDDDQKCRVALKNLLLQSSTKFSKIEECSSADEAKILISTSKPDIIFLDVEMPLKSGFDLLNELEQIDFDIIFTTGYDKYAIQAIRSSALDFLLKPIIEKDLVDAINRFEIKRQKVNTLCQVEVLLQNYQRPNKETVRVVVPTMNGLEFISTNHIIRLEAEGSYTTFFFTDKTKLLVAKSLKEMEELLHNKDFFRVHHSHLVNIQHIKRFNKADGGFLLMDDRSEISISRHRKMEFLEMLKRKG